jgi:hypothetical protein
MKALDSHTMLTTNRLTTSLNSPADTLRESPIHTTETYELIEAVEHLVSKVIPELDVFRSTLLVMCYAVYVHVTVTNPSKRKVANWRPLLITSLERTQQHPCEDDHEDDQLERTTSYEASLGHLVRQATLAYASRTPQQSLYQRMNTDRSV